ncbi:myeloid-derived growth factor-like isoform X2 [Branchiostoma floridae x Branchiostoma japonicum]
MARFFTFCVLLSFMICLTVSKSAKKNKDPEFEAFKKENKKEKWSHVEEGLHAEAFDLIASGETLTFERKLDDKFGCIFTYAAKPGGVPTEEWRLTMTMSPDATAYSCQLRVERNEQRSDLMFEHFQLKVDGHQRYGYSDCHRSEEVSLDKSEWTVDETALKVSSVPEKFGGKVSAVFLVTAIHVDHDEL